MCSFLVCITLPILLVNTFNLKTLVFWNTAVRIHKNYNFHLQFLLMFWQPSLFSSEQFLLCAMYLIVKDPDKVNVFLCQHYFWLTVV